MGVRPGRLYPNEPQFSILAEIYLKVPQNRFYWSGTGAQPVFRILPYFGNAPDSYAESPLYVKGFKARKKLGPMGLLWDGWGAPFEGYCNKYFFLLPYCSK